MCPWFDSWRYHLKHKKLIRKDGLLSFQEASNACIRKALGTTKECPLNAGISFLYFQVRDQRNTERSEVSPENHHD